MVYPGWCSREDYLGPGTTCPGYSSCSWTTVTTLPWVLFLLLDHPVHPAQCTPPAPGKPDGH